MNHAAGLLRLVCQTTTVTGPDTQGLASKMSDAQVNGIIIGLTVSAHQLLSRCSMMSLCSRSRPKSHSAGPGSEQEALCDNDKVMKGACNMARSDNSSASQSLASLSQGVWLSTPRSYPGSAHSSPIEPGNSKPKSIPEAVQEGLHRLLSESMMETACDITLDSGRSARTFNGAPRSARSSPLECGNFNCKPGSSPVLQRSSSDETMMAHGAFNTALDRTRSTQTWHGMARSTCSLPPEICSSKPGSNSATPREGMRRSFSETMAGFTTSFSTPSHQKVAPLGNVRRRRNTGGYHPKIDKMREASAGPGGYEHVK